MARLIQTFNPGLFDVNGNVITSLSNATVLDGYSGAVSCLWAEMVFFEVRDIATGTSVAPTAIALEGKAFADAAAWQANDNYNGWKKNTGVAGNFMRGGARICVVPYTVEVVLPVPVITNELIRLKLTVAASVNLFTPVIRAFVLRDGIGVYSVAT